MARRPSTSNRRRNSRKGGSKKSSSSKLLIVLGSLCVLGFIGWGCYELLKTPSYTFDRSHLDKYVENKEEYNLLGNGAAVYADMSDGMNFAYESDQSKRLLQTVINKFAANKAIDFFGLANNQITQLEMSHTELFNYMTNPTNYNLQKAPIEQTLARIVENRQPALLLTDFEEYKGGVIEKAAYAKKYFIDWLAMGYSITFYKWNFMERGKSKIMFMAVFDDNAERLGSLVHNAVSLTAPGLPSFVLAGKQFAFPTATNYLSLKQGGTYHTKAGVDAVSGVLEDGSDQAYYSYGKPLASADGGSGFASLDNLVGNLAEYYPLGVRWEEVPQNALRMQGEGFDAEKENPYTHFLSHLFIDFGAQDGFDITSIEARTFDIQQIMISIGNDENVDLNSLRAVPAPEINTFLKASMLPAGNSGTCEIFVDFDEKFTGSFPNSVNPSDLIRLNIVVGKAVPRVNEAKEFFTWEDNPSLADSVVMTLAASSSNPEGSVLYSYYLRSLAD